MASIAKRTSSDGKISYLVRIRRKDTKTVTKTFLKKDEAEKFIQNNEALVTASIQTRQ